MKIGIDISQIIYETGVSYYSLNLIRNLLLIDKENEYLLFGGSLRRLNDLKNKTRGLTGKFSRRFYPIPPILSDFLWNRLHILSVNKLIGDLDVFHSSDWAQPPVRAFKVTTVHDLYPILYPKENEQYIVSVHKRRLKWVKKEADRIIVPSISTKNDLIRLGFKESIIRVIYEGIDPIFDQDIDNRKINNIKLKYNIRKKYFLAVGINKRKNISRILEAFNYFSNKYQLVLIGESKINVPKSPNIILTGHLSYEERPILYSGSEGLIYPSLYEGFGLPILEAFACNVPVVTSNISSMPEIAGKAAVIVDPVSVGSIRKGIDQILERKEELIRLGENRLKDFSWEKTARQTLDVYKEAKI